MTKAPKAILDYEHDLPEIEDRDPTKPPTTHFRTVDGAAKPYEEVNGRRPSRMLLVNKIREDVDAWRAADYPGASTTTTDLFQHWFSGAAMATAESFAPYWGQREAVETLAYLIEVQKFRDVKNLIEQFAEIRRTTLLPQGVTFETDMHENRYAKVPTEKPAPESIRLPPSDLPRFACKMATGSGKTLVMALVIVWSYFHAGREVGSPLSANFLVLAPNVIVFERLRVDFENRDIFRRLGLVPPGWHFDLKVILRGEVSEPGGAGNLVVTNIQQLRDTEEDWSPTNAIDALLGRKPTGNAATKGRSMLDRVRSLDRLMVLNDEAHHVHDDELVWNQTLLGLHRTLPRGLSGWLDFSATPRFQGGAHFPWIVCDYPLAQCVEDKIVKAPVILHLVDKSDPDKVTAANVIDKYGDWIIAGVKRLNAHAKAFKDIPDTKPVVFIMCETVQQANKIGAWLVDKSSGFKLKDEEVLVIHTKGDGEVQERDLPALRKVAREIDDPANPVRVVVSVLVLREGWDVRNVTIVMGLRPGTAAAKILPEQAVGRGLRLMRQVGPENRQVLEVLGTPAFENFVRELEAEGVYIPTTTTTPNPPITVQPVKERSKFDIAIPKTSATLYRVYKRIETFDPSEVEPLFEADATTKRFVLRVQVEDALLGIELGQLSIDRPGGPLTSEIVALIVNKTQAAAGLTDQFAELYPLVEAYMAQRCFGEPANLDDENIRRFLADPVNQNKVASFLGRKLGELTAEKRAVELEADSILLSKTPPFHWRRQHTVVDKTIFNYVATFNPFETAFAEFLQQKCKDVRRFAALAEHFTGFWVDYLKPSGAIGRYFPDWVAVQETPGGDVNWIVETKGRVWEGTEEKDAAIRYWCSQVTDLAGEPWKYMRVDQPVFKPDKLGSFADLVDVVTERDKALDTMVLFSP
jgi:type III restriction enzyme